jgi:hypothetical protein
MVAPPPLPTNRNYTTFPGRRERVTNSVSAVFLDLFNLYIRFPSLSLSLSSITVNIIIIFLASLLFDWSGLMFMVVIHDVSFWIFVIKHPSRRRWTCAFIMEITQHRWRWRVVRLDGLRLGGTRSHTCWFIWFVFSKGSATQIYFLFFLLFPCFIFPFFLLR